MLIGIDAIASRLNLAVAARQHGAAVSRLYTPPIRGMMSPVPLLPRPTRPWTIAIDTGGTFTDCVGRGPSGIVVRLKLLSSGVLRVRGHAHDGGGSSVRFELPDAVREGALTGMDVSAAGGAGGRGRIAGMKRGIARVAAFAGARRAGVFDISTGEPAPVLAARLMTGTAPGAAFPPIVMRLATTRATNALLERKHAPVALFTTRGFGDVLEIGDQRRPDLFALDIVKRDPLTRDVHEVGGRLTSAGGELEPLDLRGAVAAARRARERGAQVAAVALLNAWRSDAHERAVEAVCREAGFEVVARSSDVAPTIRLLTRAQTAVAEAGLTPALMDFLRSTARAMPGSTIGMMTSAGGIVPAEGMRAVDALLSGPAGGVVGALDAARAAGVARVISFDMGGTSTDVARIAGDVPFMFEHRVGDVLLARPAVAVETVAAGGGSICRFLDGRPRVGPESAGADPGPACYGMGGPLTITDVNLLLGRIDPDRFEVPIDAGASRAALGRVVAEAATQLGEKPDEGAVLRGFIDLANDRMADAIRRVSVRRGYDPADHTLVAFGGAGGQHACALADLLGMRDVLVPADASLLSARGLMCSPVERIAERTILRTLGEVAGDLPAIVRELAASARAMIERDGIAASSGDERVRTIVSVRFVGQDNAIDVEVDDVAGVRRAFLERYEEVFGHAPSGREPEVVAVRVVVARGPAVRELDDAPAATGGVQGPGLIAGRGTSIVVGGGWRAERAATGDVRLRRVGAPARHGGDSGGSAMTVMRSELLVGRLESIAGLMGERLRTSAVSANIRERLDYSCAVLDPAGRVIASAPHVPVHLGALGVCTRMVRDALGGLGRGDVAITNHPAHGGSHLPDVTLIHPVHDDAGGLLGYVASRAHHAEIGGTAPGSMPPRATTLEEEGVVIPPMLLMAGGEPRWGALRAVFDSARWPSRRIDDNMADVEAALAGCIEGARGLRLLAAEAGAEQTLGAMRWVIDHTAGLVREAARSMGPRATRAEEVMDDGTIIRAEVAPVGGGLRIDFTGTSNGHAGNLNAPVAIVGSAVAYVMRLLVGRDLSLNEGLLEAVELVVPEGCVLRPVFAGDDPGLMPAVAAGNVETSQRVVGCLVRALGLAASSQGTMNNVLFGNDRFGSYETICGGAGATARAAGASAVHTHMTNTAIADPEIVEHRFPVRVRRFGVRRGSGGAGLHRGGDGVERELEFLEPAQLSVVGEHRVRGPRGMAGGGDGAPGRVRVVRVDGSEEVLAPVDGRAMEPGDRVIIETPGGGAWGIASGGG